MLKKEAEKMINKNPRVLVGCPTSSHKKYCLAEYARVVKALTYKNANVLLVDNSKEAEDESEERVQGQGKEESYAKKIKAAGLPVIKSPFSEYTKDRIINARNLLRQKALEGGYDYLLILEQDVIPPTNIIEGLLKHNKKVISGVVSHMFPKGNKWIEKPMLAVKSQRFPGKLAFLTVEQIKRVNAIIRVDYCSMGCLLIARDILEKIKFRYEEYKEANKDNPEDVRWDDMCFCADVQLLGEEIFADLGAKCRHLILGGYSVTLGDTSKVRLSAGDISIKDIMKD